MSKGQGTAIIVLLLLILVAVCVNIFIGGKAQAVKWEYRIETIEDMVDFVWKMDQLGNEGWELAFARRAIAGEGYSARGVYEFIFKRPKVFK